MGCGAAPPGTRGRWQTRPPPRPLLAPAHWRPRRGRGEVAVAVIPFSLHLPSRQPCPSCPSNVSRARSRRSMFRAAASLGPRLGRRLLSAAATQAVPAPNQQPEVLFNQVRPLAPGLCSLAETALAGWEGSGPLRAPVYPVGARGVCCA